MKPTLLLLLCLPAAACARTAAPPASTAPAGGAARAEAGAAPAAGAATAQVRDDRDAWPWPDAAFVAPTPREVVRVPGDEAALANRRHPLIVELASPPADLASLEYRRLSPADPNRLMIEIRADGPFDVEAVTFGDWKGKVERAADRSFFLELPAFVGYYDLRVGAGDRWVELDVPATTIALDGRRLLLNGDEFLSKGALVLWGNWDVDVLPTPATSFRMKNFGLNTVLSPPSEYYERWGFASIRRAHSLTITKDAIRDAPADSFLAQSARLVARVPTAYQEFISSPMDVASFFSNESASAHDEAANTRNRVDQYGRLNSYLARMHNAAKEVSPMMPTAYASHTPGFRPVPWLDLLMYNSYYPKDRYDQSLQDFAAFQGYPAKPLYHKEFSANTYLDQIYQGGGNNPVFGKLREWAFRQRWQDYMEIGSLGGGIYTAFDYKESTEGRDGNTTAFGFLTADQQPKLVAHAVWNEYVDLVFDAGHVTNRRPYPLRNLTLMLLGPDGTSVVELDSLAPGQRLAVEAPAEFTWVAQFDTHGGLLQQQMGAYPDEHTERVFASLLPETRSRDFEQRLLPTEVIGWDGGTDRYLMDRFKNDDGVITVALRRGPGEYYLTAWSQTNPDPANPTERHTLEFFDVGEVRLIDDVTGEPLDIPIEHEVRDGKLVFPDLELPRIGRSISQRSATPIRLPVIEVSRSGFAWRAPAEPGELVLPDQFQLGAAARVGVGDGRVTAVAQRFVTGGDNLRSIVVKPLADTGKPSGDVTLRVHLADARGGPGEVVAETRIGGSEWAAHAGRPLRVALSAELDPSREYVFVLTSEGSAASHRNVATAGFASSSVTPSYGGGGLLVRQGGAWQPVAAGNESLFFLTLTGR